jgi:DNA-directed RNA polymerase omega subunit
MAESSRQPHQGSKPKMNSKFMMVIAASKRSKQIASEAKAKGLSPNQVSLVRSRFVKPTTLALEELKAGKVRCVRHQDFSSEITESQEQSPDTEEEDSDSFPEPLGPGEIETSKNEC